MNDDEKQAFENLEKIEEFKEIENPLITYWKPLGYMMLAVIIAISYFGVIGPFAISQSSDISVLLGFAGFFATFAVCFTLVIKAINSTAKIMFNKKD
jgi:uncharacterized membrane protein